MDDELFAVEHCKKIVCSTPPDVCPICKENINYENIPSTVSLMSPFQNVHSIKNRLLIALKPTDGIWNSVLEHEEDMHIGISYSNTGVLNYSWTGVTVDYSGWEHSIVAYEMPRFDAEQWEKLWIATLDDMFRSKIWKMQNYNEEKNNCFDFVLQFMVKMNTEIATRCGKLEGLQFLNESNDIGWIKNIFVHNFVLPQIKTAAQYEKFLHTIAKFGYSLYPS